MAVGIAVGLPLHTTLCLLLSWIAAAAVAPTPAGHIDRPPWMLRQVAGSAPDLIAVSYMHTPVASRNTSRMGCNIEQGGAAAALA